YSSPSSQPNRPVPAWACISRASYAKPIRQVSTTSALLRAKAASVSTSPTLNGFFKRSRSLPDTLFARRKIMSKPLALVIDDEPDIRELLEITLGRMGIQTESAASLSQAGEMIEAKHFDLCLTDMRLPDGNGIDFVKKVQRDFPNVPIAVITAHGNMDTAIEAMKAGAFDFISKPVELEDLRKIAAAALRLRSEPDAKQTPDLLGEAA